MDDHILANNVGVPKEGWMQIANGHIFYPLDPRVEDVYIKDIAQSLSRQNRYNGNSDRIVNVAQHSVQAAWLAEQTGASPDVMLAMLMHDAPEYVTGDMIRPMKSHCPEFTRIEDRIMAVINIRFNLPTIDHKVMKYYDNVALAWEKRDMYKSSRDWPDMEEVPNWCPIMGSWSSGYSEARFLKLFHHLQLERVFPTK